METSNTRNINYNFIAVPTNLFFALDNNLRNALTVLLQLSSVFADSDGYFFRTNEDLQSDFKMGKNLTIAVLESLYQYGLLQVKSVGFTKKNGKRQVNFFRVNTERFKDFEQYHIYTITKNEELHLETVDYKFKDFKVTYTASTVEDSEISPTSVQNNVSEETPSNDTKNVSERQEIGNLDFVELAAPTEDEKNDEIIPTESDKDLEYLDFVLSSNSGVDETEKIKKVVKEVEEIEKEKKQKELQQKLVVNVDGEKIETASAIPTNLSKVEKRSIYTNSTTEKLDDSVRQKCAELVKRYVEMTIPSSNQSLELCNKGVMYIQDKFKQGFISLEDKDHFTRELIQARFIKHRI